MKQMNKKLDYLKASKVKQLCKDCDWLLLLGERSNGKSYASKEYIFTECWKNKKKFIYLRRYDLDVKDTLCSRYFANVPIEAITNGEFTHVDVYRKTVYLCTYDEEKAKMNRIYPIGYCVPLNNDERIKSLVYDDVDFICFEEIISKDGRYLYNEPDRLQNVCSSVFRQRKATVIMIGNTISRQCVYYREWHLDRIKKQKLGTCDRYLFKNDNGEDTRLSVYLTDSLNFNSGMFFGLSANSITKGAYEVSRQPHLPKPYNSYKKLYSFVLEHYDFKYLCELLEDKDDHNVVWYVTPKTTEIKEKTRVISNQFNPSFYYSRNLRDCVNENEKRIFSLFKRNKVCFSDNLTGTEFNDIIEEYL